jgi:hypothetical protein
MPPFAAMTPVIVTHRFFGRSIADLVMDIQRIKTALLRSILDNAYLASIRGSRSRRRMPPRPRSTIFWSRGRAASCAPRCRAA